MAAFAMKLVCFGITGGFVLVILCCAFVGLRAARR